MCVCLTRRLGKVTFRIYVARSRVVRGCAHRRASTLVPRAVFGVRQNEHRVDSPRLVDDLEVAHQAEHFVTLRDGLGREGAHAFEAEAFDVEAGEDATIDDSLS